MKSKNNKTILTKTSKNYLEGKTFHFYEDLSTNRFSEITKVPKSDILKYYFEKSKMITPLQLLNYDQIEELCTVFNLNLQKQNVITHETVIEQTKVFDVDFDTEERPPIVTIMGHVDHGKTTLLDYLRKSSLVNDESGGITQHIGAYTIKYHEHKITVLDTPGHKAFASMRARGANITDIILLVIAADDGVKPQTIEAINHAKNANAPIIVVLTKIDKEEQQIENIKKDCADHGITPEEWGGKNIFVGVSAVTGKGINDLLENIWATAEILELKSNSSREAVGIVIEARNEKGKGNTATLLIQNGVLKLGDSIVINNSYGKVRSLINENFQNVKVAHASEPVRISGLTLPVQAGDKFVCFLNNKEARKIAESRIKKWKSVKNYNSPVIHTSQIEEYLEQKHLRTMNFIIKADTNGTAEAIKSMVSIIKNKEIQTRVIATNNSPISETDILLAIPSKAVILAFKNFPTAKIRATAKKDDVEIREYNIIYDIEKYVKNLIDGALTPIQVESVVGEAEVRQLFESSKKEIIAGSIVKSGQASINKSIKVLRAGKNVHTGDLSSLKHLKNDVKSVRQGMECGILISDYNDVKVNDIIQFFEIVLKRP